MANNYEPGANPYGDRIFNTKAENNAIDASRRRRAREAAQNTTTLDAFRRRLKEVERRYAPTTADQIKKRRDIAAWKLAVAEEEERVAAWQAKQDHIESGKDLIAKAERLRKEVDAKTADRLTLAIKLFKDGEPLDTLRDAISQVAREQQEQLTDEYIAGRDDQVQAQIEWEDINARLNEISMRMQKWKDLDPKPENENE